MFRFSILITLLCSTLFSIKIQAYESTYTRQRISNTDSTYYLVTNKTWIYAMPNKDAKTKAYFIEGDEIYPISVEDDWIKVAYDKSRLIGWLSKNNLHNIKVIRELKDDCNDINEIKEAVSDIDNTSTVLELNEVNNLIKKCVPELEEKEILALLRASLTMYDRFLDIYNLENSTRSNLESYDDFYNYAYTLDNGNPQQKLFNKLPERLRYLINYRGKSYIKLKYYGEGVYDFTYDTSYVTDIFLPHLSDVHTNFLGRMAVDNNEEILMDAGIVIPLHELVSRLLYWEHYARKYPNSPYADEVNYLINQYLYFMFIGSENTQWLLTEQPQANAWYHDEPRFFNDLDVYKKLSNYDTKSGRTAQKLLNHLTSEEYKKIIQDDNYMGVHPSLRETLGIKDIFTENYFRDCTEGVLCPARDN